MANEECTLNPQQEAFCQFYADHRGIGGNATKCYALAYDYDLDGADKDDEERDRRGKIIRRSSYDRMYNVCAVSANDLLKNPNIRTRIREIFKSMLSDEMVDSKLSEIITSGKHADAIQGIREYNKLKQRITEKLDVTSGGKTIAGFNFIRNSNGNTPDDTPDA
jgi:hypothetical protein